MNVENFINDFRAIQRNSSDPDLRQKLYSLGEKYYNLNLGVPAVINFIATNIDDGELMFFVEDLPLTLKKNVDFFQELKNYYTNYNTNRNSTTAADNFIKDFSKLKSLKDAHAVREYLHFLTTKYGHLDPSIASLPDPNISDNVLMSFAENFPAQDPKYDDGKGDYIVSKDLIGLFTNPTQKPINLENAVKKTQKYYRDFLTKYQSKETAAFIDEFQKIQEQMNPADFRKGILALAQKYSRQNMGNILQNINANIGDVDIGTFMKKLPVLGATPDEIAAGFKLFYEKYIKQHKSKFLEQLVNEFTKFKTILDPDLIIKNLTELRDNKDLKRGNLKIVLELILKNVHRDDMIFFIHSLQISGTSFDEIAKVIRDHYNDYWVYRNQILTTNILSRTFKAGKLPSAEVIRKNISNTIRLLENETNNSWNFPPTYQQYLVQNKDVFTKFIAEKNDSDIPQIIEAFLESGYSNFADYYHGRPNITSDTIQGRPSHMDIGLTEEEKSTVAPVKPQNRTFREVLADRFAAKKIRVKRRVKERFNVKKIKKNINEDGLVLYTPLDEEEEEELYHLNSYKDCIFFLPSVKKNKVKEFFLTNMVRKTGVVDKYIDVEKPLEGLYENKKYFQPAEIFFKMLYEYVVDVQKLGRESVFYFADTPKETRKYFNFIFVDEYKNISHISQEFFLEIIADVESMRRRFLIEAVSSWTIGDETEIGSKRKMIDGDESETSGTLSIQPLEKYIERSVESEFQEYAKAHSSALLKVLPRSSFRTDIKRDSIEGKITKLIDFLYGQKNLDPKIKQYFSRDSRGNDIIEKIIKSISAKILSMNPMQRGGVGIIYIANQFIKFLPSDTAISQDVVVEDLIDEFQTYANAHSSVLLELVARFPFYEDTSQKTPEEKRKTPEEKRKIIEEKIIKLVNFFSKATDLDPKIKKYFSRDFRGGDVIDKIIKSTSEKILSMDQMQKNKIGIIYIASQFIPSTPSTRTADKDLRNEFQEYVDLHSSDLLELLPYKSFSIDTRRDNIEKKIMKLVDYFSKAKDLNPKIKQYFSRDVRGGDSIDRIIKRTSTKILAMGQMQKDNVEIIYISKQFIPALLSHQDEDWENEFSLESSGPRVDFEEENDDDFDLNELGSDNYPLEQEGQLGQKSQKSFENREKVSSRFDWMSVSDENMLNMESSVSSMDDSRENEDSEMEDLSAEFDLYDLTDPDFQRYLRSQKKILSEVLPSPLWKTRKQSIVENIIKNFVRFLMKDDNFEPKFKLFFSRKSRGDDVIDEIIENTAKKIINMNPDERSKINEIFLIQTFMNYRSPSETEENEAIEDNENDGEFQDIHDEMGEYSIENRPDLATFNENIAKNINDTQKIIEVLRKWINYLINDIQFPSSYKELFKKYIDNTEIFDIKENKPQVEVNLRQLAEEIQGLSAAEIQEINIYYLVRKVLEKMDVFSPVFQFKDKYNYREKFFNLAVFRKHGGISSVWISNVSTEDKIQYYVDYSIDPIDHAGIKFYAPNENFYRIFFNEMMIKEQKGDVFTIRRKGLTKNTDEKIDFYVMYTPQSRGFRDSLYKEFKSDVLTEILSDKEVVRITYRDRIQRSQCKLLQHRADWIPNVKYVLIKSDSDISQYVIDETSDSNPLTMKKLVRNTKRASGSSGTPQPKYIYEKKYPQIESGWKVPNENFYNLLCSGSIEYTSKAIIVRDGIHEIQFNLAYLTEVVVQNPSTKNVLTDYANETDFSSSFSKIRESIDKLIILKEIFNLIEIVSVDPKFPTNYKEYFMNNKNKPQFKYAIDIIAREISIMSPNSRSKIDIAYIVNRILKKMDVDYAFDGSLDGYTVQNNFVIQTPEDYMKIKKYVDDEWEKYNESILAKKVSTKSPSTLDYEIIRLRVSGLDNDIWQVGYRYLENIIYKQNANFDLKYFYDTAHWMTDSRRKILLSKENYLLILPVNTMSYQFVDDFQEPVVYGKWRLQYPNSFFYDCMGNYDSKTVRSSGEVVLNYRGRDYVFQMGFYSVSDDGVEDFTFYNDQIWTEEQKYLTNAKKILDSYVKTKAYYDNLNVHIPTLYNSPPWVHINKNFEVIKDLANFYRRLDGNTPFVSVTEEDFPLFEQTQMIYPNSVVYSAGINWYMPTLNLRDILRKTDTKGPVDDTGLYKVSYNDKLYKFRFGNQVVHHNYGTILIKHSPVTDDRILFHILPEHLEYYLDIIKSTIPEDNVIDDYNNIWYVPNDYFFELLQNFSAKKMFPPPAPGKLEFLYIYTDTKVYEMVIGFVSPRFRGIVLQDIKMLASEENYVKKISLGRLVLHDADSLKYKSEALAPVARKFPLQHMDLRWKLILMKYMNQIQKFMIYNSKITDNYVDFIAHIMPIAHGDNLFHHYIRNYYYRVSGIFDNQNPEIIAANRVLSQTAETNLKENFSRNVTPSPKMMQVLIENNKRMILTEIINKKLPSTNKKYPSIIYNQQYKAFVPGRAIEPMKEINPYIYDMTNENEAFLTARTYDVDSLAAEMSGFSL